jgi:peptidoglycan/LPS O-acetylase OafA/YrhL
MVAATASGVEGRRAVGFGFRRDIQGLRAVAILLVVAYHTDGLLPGGFVGVDAFFVLSGYLIGGLLLAEHEATGRIDIPRFFRRRVRRLLPALAVATTVTVVVALLVLEPGDQVAVAAGTGIAVSLFGANVQLYRAAADYFAPAAELNPLLHTWSLSLEEQFYLVFPLLLAVVVTRPMLRARPNAARAAIAVLLVVSVLGSFVLNRALVDGGGSFLSLVAGERFAFYAPLTRAWEFGVGAVLALALQHAPALRGRASMALGTIGVALLGWAAWSYGESTPFPGTAATVPVIGTAALLAAGSGASPLTRMLSRRSLVWIGDLSYSWYLWHWPCIVFARALWPDRPVAIAVAAVGSLLPAWASYRGLERRFRRDESLTGRRVVVLAMVAIVVPLLAALSVQIANERLRPEPVTDLANTLGCAFEPDQPGDWPAEACELDLAGAGAPTVLLLGDSHAAALSDAVRAAADANGANLAIWTRNSTPLVGSGDLVLPPLPTSPVGGSLALVDRLRPDVVVVANRSPQYLLPGFTDRWSFGSQDSGVDELTLWEQEVGQVVDALLARGTTVLWSAVVPEYPSAAGLQVSLVRPTPRGSVLDLATVRDRRQAVVDAERRVMDRHDRVQLFDPVAPLCAETCANVADGIALYRDEHHLAPAGGGLLAEPLGEMLGSLLEVSAAAEQVPSP